MRNVWRTVGWSLRNRGLFGTLRQAVTRSRHQDQKVHTFDARYGTDTGGVIGGGSLAAGHAHDARITAYAAMPPSRLEATLARWMAGRHGAGVGDVTFVDVGCGKGRVVLLASRWGFKRVLGVELNRGLVETAEANLAIWRSAGEAGSPVEVVCADATEFRLPEGSCLVYLANPFGAPVLRLLLERLESRDGAVDLIYQNPDHAAVFADRSRWRPLWNEEFPLSAEDASVEPVFGPTDRCRAWRLESGTRGADAVNA